MATAIQIGSTLGRYRVLQQLGSGGMGVVFRAYDERLRREVAIKIVPPHLVADDSVRQRFRHEARSLSGLNHPNVATIFDFDQDKSFDFIVMELVDGENLDERLLRGELPEREVVRAGGEIAKGLAAAHAAGILHCDLKPANIRCCADGRMKILDFGLARRYVPGTDLSTTASVPQGAASGTLPYMAPEQLRGQSLDARSDVWGLGAVLYEMATGQRAFPQPDAVSVIAAVLNNDPTLPRTIQPNLSTGLESIILRCLEKDPAARYQSAAEVAEALHAFEHLTPAGVRSKHTLRSSIAVLAVLLAVGVAGWLWQSRRSAAAPIRSIAVLPLENLNGGEEQDPLVDGMTEDLITNLAKVRALRVVSRTSVMRYRHTEKTVPQIAKELDVDAILEGSVERAGNRIRITAQLIRAASDENVWAESYDRQLSDVLRLQDEVARSIAEKIKVTVTPDEAARLSEARAVDPEAYQLYVKGRYFWAKRNKDSIEQALHFFQQALDTDPTYAPAYAGLADCYGSLSMFGVGALPPTEAMPKAREAAQKAISLDDGLSEAHTSLAFIRMNYDWDWARAEAEFERALELNPGYAQAHHLHAHLLLSQGHFEEALNESEAALKLDPLNPSIATHLGWHYLYTRQYEKAKAQFQKVIEMEPTFTIAHSDMALAYLQLHDKEGAIAEYKKARELSSENRIVEAQLGYGYAMTGNPSQARKILKDLESEANRRFTSPYDVALIHVALGEKNKAFQMLNAAYTERSDLLIYLNLDPRLDPIRKDARFVELVKRVGLNPPN